MGELIKLIVTELWKRLIEPLLKGLDTTDFLFLTIIAIAFVGWLKFWSQYLIEGEWYLSASLFGLLIAVWFILRTGTRKKKKSILIKPRVVQRTSPRMRKIVIKIALSIVLIASWAYAVFVVYRIPTFRQDVMGIHVARFENDIGGIVQKQIVEFLKDEIKGKDLEGVIEVQVLPRRISQDEGLARSLAKQSHASAVLWGEVVGDKKFKSHMVTVNTEDTYQQVEISKYGGSQKEWDDFYELPRDLQALATSVVVFLAGYKLYHDEKYEQSLAYFIEAQKQLLGNVPTQSYATVDKVMLGSVCFYMGNALLLTGQFDQALKSYRDAVRYTSNPTENAKAQYIQPLNNLGYALNRTNQPGEAIEQLERAENLCRERGNESPGICAVATFNLGYAKQKVKNDVEAIKIFRRAIQQLESLQTNQQDTQYLELLPIAHQSTAFSLVRLGHNTDTDRNLREAEEELAKVKGSLGYLRSDQAKVLRDYPSITEARIHIARGQWQRALDALNTANLPDDPDLNMLLTLVHSCLGNEKLSKKYQEKFVSYVTQTSLSDPGIHDDVEYLRQMMEKCRKPQSN